METVAATKQVGTKPGSDELFTTGSSMIQIGLCAVLMLCFVTNSQIPGAPALAVMVATLKTGAGIGFLCILFSNRFNMFANKAMISLTRMLALISAVLWAIGQYGDGLYQAVVADPAKAVAFVLAVLISAACICLSLYTLKVDKPTNKK